MKIFHKTLAFLLVLSLVLGLMPIVLAQSPDITLLSQQMLDRSLYIMSMAAHKGSLYIKA
ncbi:MAG: hypothetical protein GX781_06995, partial [Clostridiales bacterium]|nr:hypothetical protein [Clostridiales bacterium]